MTALERLRAATGAAHEASERRFDWKARMATVDGYRDVLAALYGFHAAWEERAGAALADPALFDPRRRAHLLADDLRHLGMPDAALGRLGPAAQPPLPGRASALGSLYVVEGSRLGGRLIARHVETTLGMRPGAGLSYYGGAPGASWRRLCARLNADLRAGEALDAALAAALDTFACLGGVLARPAPG